MELGRLFDDFGRSLLRRELSPKTADSYAWALRDFRRFVNRSGVTEAGSLHRRLIESWQDHNRTHLGRSSRSLAATALRQFLRWAVAHDYVDPRAPYWVTHVKGKRTHPRPIPGEVLHEILGYLAQRRFAGTLTDLRNRALFLFILTTGTRVSEALQFRRADITRAIIRQKGGGDREVEVPPVVVEALEDYLQERRDAQPWMWITMDSNHPTRPLSAAGVREIWRRMALRLSVPPWTTHQLRHTGASQLYEAGIDGLVVADFLGHTGMGHVAQYTRVPRLRRQEAAEVLQNLIEKHSRPPSLLKPKPSLFQRGLERT